jgi:hypothetical protein
MSRVAFLLAFLCGLLLALPARTSPPRCSHSGGTCSSNADCCSAENVCSEGVCRSSPSRGLSCSRGGGRCDTSDTCCPGFFCAGAQPGAAWPTGVCTASPSCVPMDSPCGGSLSCCEGLVCRAGACVPPTLAQPQSCGAPAAACGVNTDCCLGLTCSAGRCTALAHPYQDVGEDCDAQALCAAGNTCVSGRCWDNIALAEARGERPPRVPGPGGVYHVAGELCRPQDVCTRGACMGGVCLSLPAEKKDSTESSGPPLPADSIMRYREKGAAAIWRAVNSPKPKPFAE